MSFALNSGVITQTGIDADLSGLNITGVTVTTIGGITQYDVGTNRIVINGTLTHDDPTNILVSNSTASTATDDGFGDSVIDIDGGTFNIGSRSTINGVTYTKTGTFVRISGANNTNHYQPCGIRVKGGGTWNWFSGTVETNRSCGVASDDPSNFARIYSTDCVLMNTGVSNGANYRSLRCTGESDDLQIDGITFDSVNSSIGARLFSITGLDVAKGLKFRSGELQSRNGSSASLDTFSIEGISFGENRNSKDVVLNGDLTNWNSSSFSVQSYEIYNCDIGSAIVVQGAFPATRYGIVGVFQKLNLTFKDASQAPIEGVKFYLPSTNNGDRRAIGCTGNGSNFNNYDFTATTYDKYEATTNVNGETGVIDVLLGAILGDTTSTDHQNLDTILYSKTNTKGVDDFTFKACKYEYAISTFNVILHSNKTITGDYALVEDITISQSDKSVVDDYDEIDDPRKFYDRAKSYLYDNYAGETSTIVSREGNSIDAGSYNVVIDGNVTNAASAFSISGNTLTIKATRFVGNIATTGTTTLSNGAEIIGTFGSTTVLPWEVKNVEGTSRIQIVNVTQSNTEVVNTKLTSTDPFIDASGTYTGDQISVGDTVRLRVTCVVGAEALLPVLQTGVATSTGLTFQVDQEADTIYNTHAIDGSQLSAAVGGTFTADYTNTPMGIDLSETDGNATVQEIYAFLVYSQTTADGVSEWFNAVRAIDVGNYELDQTIADIKFQNVGSVAVNITGGRIFRKDGSSVLYGELGDYPLTLDTGALVTNILPQIQDALSTDANIQSIKNNAKLIPSLL